MILDKISQYIPGSHNFGHFEKNIAPQVIAAGIQALASVAGGIVGSGKRRKEQSEAQIGQREAQYNYENFDYNQDVGYINDPYKQLAAQTQEFEGEQIDKTLATATYQQQQAGQFGNTTGIVQQGVSAGQKSAQRVNKIRQAGASYVEKIRQQRIQQEYGQAETLLGRADVRLTAANKARQAATQQLFKGIGQAAGSAAGAIGGAGGAAEGVGGFSGGSNGVGAFGDSTFSAGGYNASSSFLNQTSVPQVPNIGDPADFSQFLTK